MASIDMVHPRGQGRRATNATTEDVEALLPASDPPAGARTRSDAPVAVAQSGVGLFERVGDVADAMLPTPPRPRDLADRRRVWTWATVSFLLMCLMFGSVAGGPGVAGTRTREIALDGPSSSGNEQRGAARAPSIPKGSGLADDSKRADLESSAESDDASDASAARADAFDRETSRDGDDVSTDDAVDDGSAKGALDAPIPRTKGTCVTRAARVPAVLDVDPTLVSPVAGSAQWRALADALAAEAANATSDLVLVGDSITEAWRGTSFGARRAQYASAPEILARRLGEYSPLPLAIAGDTTANVLWRLRNGGFPKRAPAYAVLLIGTNDLSRAVALAARARRANATDADPTRGDADCASDADVAALLETGVPNAVGGIVAVVEALVALAPDAKIAVLGITPRGERIRNRLSYLQPSVWTAAIDAVNARVETFLDRGRRAGALPFRGSRRYWNVVFQPCAEPFLARDAAGGGKRVDERLMRDGLHPNGAGGFDALGECVVAGVEKAKRVAR